LTDIGKKKGNRMWNMEPYYIPVMHVVLYYPINLRVDYQDIPPDRIDVEVR
jgi:hypothetical protein